jgi:signal transduction histidine kinase
MDKWIMRDGFESAPLRWGLQASDSALALVRGGRLSHVNSRWVALERAGIWQLVAAEGVPPRIYADLNALALGEARIASTLGASTTIERFRLRGTDRILEMRIERVGDDLRPLIILFAQDISDRRARGQGLRLRREELFQKERLRVLGELASAVAHDLGSTLRTMEMRLSAFETTQRLPELQQAALIGLRESLAAATQSVRTLAEMARSGRLVLGPVNLESILEKAIAVLRMEVRHTGPAVRIAIELAKDLPPVLGTTPELSHLFINLLRNARDAMPGGGVIRVAAHASASCVQVMVTDQGHGLSAEAQRRLFEPFFTTKGRAGTGLGLWLAANTLRRIDGRISGANLEGGGGAVFTVELPIASPKRPAARKTRLASPPGRPGPKDDRRRSGR